jgi:3-oxoacyl-[acyl-carrier-protein] synthase-3
MNTYSRFLGTGSFFPPNVMTNHDFEKFLDTSDEWIVTRTGIKERRISKGMTTGEMAYEAAKNALDMAGLKPEELDGIILASLTADTTMPSTACNVQKMLGIRGCFAFDITAACSGFIYAVNIADSMIKAGSAKKILVIGSERLSASLDWTDRGTCILFGDGAGAAVIGADTEPGIRSIYTHADGAYGDLLTLNALGSTYLAKRKEINIESQLIHMSGNEIFKIAVRAMADAADAAVASSGLTYSEIDYLIPHQANLRIIDATAKRLKLPPEKVVINLDKYGNTSAATIPTAIDGVVRNGSLQRGMNVACAAFGGGLTWGSMVFTF